MKKFTKICLLTALFLAVVSTVCFVVGGILGISPAAAIRNAFRFGIMQEEKYGEDFDKNYHMEDFTLEKEWKAGDVQSLSINVDIGTVVVRSVSSDACRVWVDEGSYAESLTVTLDDAGELSIEEVSYHTHSFRFSDLALLGKGNLLIRGTKIIVELPDNKKLSAIDGNIQLGAMKLYDIEADRVMLNVDAGAVYSEGTISGDRAEIIVGMGAASMDNIECGQVVINADMGDVHVNAVTADTLAVDADMGNVDLSKIRAGHLEADCDMGNIKLELIGKPKDYYISYDVDMGSIDIDKDTADHAASARYTAELNCNMGNIDVTFIKPAE